MKDPVPSGRALLRHGSVSSAHSAVTSVYGLKFLEFQKIRHHCLSEPVSDPDHLIGDAANLSTEGRQPALPHHGLRCHPCQANGDGSCCSNLVIHHCQALLLASDIGQHRQSTFSGGKCYLGLFVGRISDEEVGIKDLLHKGS